jgi:hypothetical protein
MALGYTIQQSRLVLRFREDYAPVAAIRARIAALLQLCGQDPSSSFAAKYDALPLRRDLTGWTGLRSDGELIFVDDATGRVVAELPGELVSAAREVLAREYPELLP